MVFRDIVNPAEMLKQVFQLLMTDAHKCPPFGLILHPFDIPIEHSGIFLFFHVDCYAVDRFSNGTVMKTADGVLTAQISEIDVG